MRCLRCSSASLDKIIVEVAERVSAGGTEWAVEGCVVAVCGVWTEMTAVSMGVQLDGRLAGLKPYSCQH